MTYFAFCKNILLHPIAFLNQYFVGDKTPEEFEKKTWFLLFKLWGYLLCILSVFGAIIGHFIFGTIALLIGLVAPTLVIIIYYAVLKLEIWFFHKCITWAGFTLTVEKAKNLCLYVILHCLLIKFVIGLVEFLILFLLPLNTSLFIASLFVEGLSSIFFPLYVVYISYKLTNKVTGIPFPTLRTILSNSASIKCMRSNCGYSLLF